VQPPSLATRAEQANETPYMSILQKYLLREWFWTLLAVTL
jgi:hypothetical protein